MSIPLEKPTTPVQFYLACFLLGFSSLIAQIVLFREMMVAFYGNELCLGVLLSVWLFWVGIGSFLGNKIAGKEKYSSIKLSLWYFLISLATLTTIVLIRFSKQILGTAPAEIVGFVPMFIFSFALMSFLCLVLGITFVLNSKSWTGDETRVYRVNRVYLWESLGAGVGGLFVTFVLIPIFSNFQITILLFSLDLIFCALLLTQNLQAIKKSLIWALVILIVFGFSLSNLGRKMDNFSAAKEWRGLPLIYSQDTRYGNISVTKQYEQVTFYENGLMLFSSPDVFSAEEAVHFALLEHPHPRTLLLIGGGMGDALSQSLKYDSLKIDYVELDPELIKIGERFLPLEETRSLKSPRVKIHFMDGRLFVKERLKAKSHEFYDVIIVNLPDPYTAQLNRFFTLEFFQMTRSLLKDDGIFSFRVSSAENYISPELGLYLSSIYQTLSSCFSDVLILPGSNNVYLASNRNGMLFDDWQMMVARLKQRNISTQFVNENFLPDRLSPARIEYLRNALTQSPGRINRDLEPISYFYNSILWSKQFKSFEKPVLIFLSRIPSGWLVGAIALIFLLIFISLRWHRAPTTNLTLAAIFVAGFTSIFVEMIIVLSFQIFYGYIYSLIGLIFTLFMLGLTGGALMGQRAANRGKISFKNLTFIQLIQVTFTLVFLILILWFPWRTFSNLGIAVLLLLLIAWSGILGGVIFTLANHIYLERRSTSKAGTGYSVDLFGSGLSSILASAILIPILGIPGTLILILLVNLILLLMLSTSLKSA
jgi:spermidine synthase